MGKMVVGLQWIFFAAIMRVAAGRSWKQSERSHGFWNSGSDDTLMYTSNLTDWAPSLD